MKLKQSVRHFAAKQALTMPVVGDLVSDRLVDFHTSVFTGKADPGRADEREEHLDGFFDASMDSYVAALEAGYTEAGAREITHVQANFDFYNHGWTEMMEIPPEELDTHYERYRDFFETFDITITDPLGTFAPTGGIPGAPSTPTRLDEATHRYTKGGFADDVYVEGPDGETIVGGHDEPNDVALTDAPGVSDEDV